MHNKFGINLKHIRESREMTQEQLATLLGTSKQVISRYETGQRFPKVSTVMEYADKLDVSISQLTGYPNESINKQEEKPVKYSELPPERQQFYDKVMKLDDRLFKMVNDIVDSVLRERDE